MLGVRVSRVEGRWTANAEQHRKEDEAVEQAVGDDQHKDLEEGEEDVRIRIGQEDEGQKGAEATVEDGRPDRLDGGDGALVARPRRRHESVRHVGRVVDAQADGQD